MLSGVSGASSLSLATTASAAIFSAFSWVSRSLTFRRLTKFLDNDFDENILTGDCSMHLPDRCSRGWGMTRGRLEGDATKTVVQEGILGFDSF
jgi:hypothetical protein